MPLLACQKHEFSLPDGYPYLNCAYMGPLPVAAERAAEEGLRAKRFPQAIAPEDFFRPSDELRIRFARLIGAPRPSSVAIVPAVSYAVSTVARNTAIGPGRLGTITSLIRRMENEESVRIPHGGFVARLWLPSRST